MQMKDLKTIVAENIINTKSIKEIDELQSQGKIPEELIGYIKHLIYLKNQSKQLLIAVEQSNLSAVKDLLKIKDININIQDKEGQTPLMLAIKRNHQPIIIELINHGADLNIQDKDGKTALMLAIMDINQSMAIKLMDGSADLNIRDKNGKTALMFAISKGDANMTHKLIDRHVDLNIKDANGATPLMIARSERNWNIARMLIENGALDMQ